MDAKLKELQKKEALVRMKLLKLQPSVIEEFQEDGKLYYSERLNSVFNAVLYWVDNHPEYMDLVRQFEKKHNALVYHCQLTHTIDGDQLSLLYVSDTITEWKIDRQDLLHGYAYAKVEVIDDDMFSEIGCIGVKPSMGGVLRTA